MADKPVVIKRSKGVRRAIRRRGKQVTKGQAKPRPKRTVKEPGKAPRTTGVPMAKKLFESRSEADRVTQELVDAMIAEKKEKEKQEKQQKKNQK